eukprot:TRINITY_DN14161_c0_g1_i1.p1 TRINITY_DN14161_c0_g1~~TRINITY_DN14161_c0_g1_i1.p1  ORF type:complete len:536 (-),score=82.63 TRINITY_DN14161_c0_g1_i1:321-1928(-)
MLFLFFFFFQAEDGIRDLVRSRGLGDVYKRQGINAEYGGNGRFADGGSSQGLRLRLLVISATTKLRRVHAPSMDSLSPPSSSPRGIEPSVSARAKPLFSPAVSPRSRTAGLSPHTPGSPRSPRNGWFRSRIVTVETPGHTRVDSKGTTVNSVQVLVKDKPFGEMRSMVEAFYLDSANSNFEGCEFFLESDGIEVQLKETEGLGDLVGQAGAVPTLIYKRSESGQAQIDAADAMAPVSTSGSISDWSTGALAQCITSMAGDSSHDNLDHPSIRTEVIRMRLFPSPSANKLKPVILTVSEHDTAADVLDTIVRTKLQALTNHARRCILAGKAGKPPTFLEDQDLVLPYVDQGYTIVVSVDTHLWERVLKVFLNQKSLVFHMRIIHRWLRACKKEKTQKASTQQKQQLQKRRQDRFRALREAPREPEPQQLAPKQKATAKHQRSIENEKRTPQSPQTDEVLLKSMEDSMNEAQAELKRVMRKAKSLEKENEILKQESAEHDRRQHEFREAHEDLQATHREPKKAGGGQCRSCQACAIS